jgi:septal ring factor EnvC (AmiA/AmiB activator)
MTDKQLLDLKEQITKTKGRVAELKGQRNALLKQLKEEWGCTSIEVAKKKIIQMEKDITKLDADIRNGEKELDEKYPM